MTGFYKEDSFQRPTWKWQDNCLSQSQFYTSSQTGI